MNLTAKAKKDAARSGEETKKIIRIGEKGLWKALTGPLHELAEFEEIWKQREKEPGMLQISGCVNSQKTHLMYALGDGCDYKVIACSSESKAKQIYEEYRFLDGNIYLYPAKDFLFTRRISAVRS